MTTTGRNVLILATALLFFTGASDSGWAETVDGIESRGLNLPRVMIPAPPPPAMQPLFVRMAGEGRGTVAVPPAKACPPACSATYPQGTPVVLAAIPAPGSRFVGWGGDCLGMGPCTLRMDRPHTVEATFNTVLNSSSPTQSSVGTTMTLSAPVPIPIPYPNVGGPALAPELAAISTMLADNTPANVILDAWKAYVTRRVQAKQPVDVPGAIQQVKMGAEAQVKSRIDIERAHLASKRDGMNELNQQSTLELQQLMDKKSKMEQMISNMMKAFNDHANSIVQNLK
ncbi:MAG: hypothetical protein Q8N00_17325 [Nitrospirota bacterium]|nr:hypothetical protein [Nitrospirota bacterium]MDP3598885.1 hypothetical protein [Nitrospirota bacterium]